MKQPIKAEDRREARLQINITRREERAVDRLCDSLGITRSTWLRNVIGLEVQRQRFYERAAADHRGVKLKDLIKDIKK